MGERSTSQHGARVLWIEDEPSIRESVAIFLEREGYRTSAVGTVAEGRERLDAGDFDLVLTDLQLPDGHGLDLLADAHRSDPSLPVIIVTAHASVSSAVEAVRAGAFYYLEKPFDLDQLGALVGRAVGYRDLERRVDDLSERVRDKLRFGGVVGNSPAMKDLLHAIERVAPTEANILLSGPSGAGKGLVAKAIHEHSGRRRGPFVKVMCTNLPGELLQSELFGHVRGGFTGAHRDKPGKFMTASGGTLFLDEVGDMTPELQSALLGAIEDGVVDRVGADVPTPVDVRIIAATHRDLHREVERGTFREDLYWRLFVVPMEVPSLAARRSDIPLLLEHFLSKRLGERTAPARYFTPEALDTLMAYPWPGNVRELDHLVERLLALHDGRVFGAADLPAPYGGSSQAEASVGLERVGADDLPERGFSLKDWLVSAEERLLLKALEQAEWRIGGAARLLGMNRTTLHEKLKRKGIRRPESPDDERETG